MMLAKNGIEIARVIETSRSVKAIFLFQPNDISGAISWRNTLLPHATSGEGCRRLFAASLLSWEFAMPIYSAMLFRAGMQWRSRLVALG